ncbi:MAG: metalloregulator ArsR/SmtB family transcription factor [Akkermansia muciniphila]
MLEELSSFFKMLGEPVRLRLLSSLCIQGEATVGELVERLNIGQSVVSKHMKLLHESGHVEKKKQEGRILYYLADDTLCRLCEMAFTKISVRADRYSKLMEHSAGS